MSRIARVIWPGLPHHVTQRGNRRAPVFFKDSDRENYLNLLDKICLRYDVDIWSWCLMTNHVHLLLSPKDSIGLAKVIQVVARNYSLKINKEHGWTGRLWEVRYYSCVVEKETYLWIVSGYIEMNPVRAGLVSRPEQWEWSSAKAHLLGEPSKYLRLKQWLTEEEREGYRVFINERLKEKEISNVRRATSTGRPLGTKKFVLRAEKRLGRILFPKKRGRKSIK